ncbi:alanine--tRNA ligase-related protein [Streptomyces erythrochromogenes]|uniref:alanine--tRNA ligase-related protein n=1 Tax=Streptomyces erythrochromogenes TaxID=285574 RepID=UPI00380CD508
MNTGQLLSTFVEYFEERGHRRILGSTLLPPPGDPVLFTTSGMHPLTPYLEGRPHPLGSRLVNVQRCLRTVPQDLVRHTLDHFRQDMPPGDVLRHLIEEEQRFRRLLERGRQVLARPRFRGLLTEEDLHYLHDTHGLPRDLVTTLRKE